MLYLVELIGLGVVALGPRHEREDVREGSDGIGVAAHHQVAEANVVVHRHVAPGDSEEGRLARNIDVVKHLERHGVVAEHAVDAQQADYAEESKHLVKIASGIFIQGSAIEDMSFVKRGMYLMSVLDLAAARISLMEDFWMSEYRTLRTL